MKISWKKGKRRIIIVLLIATLIMVGVGVLMSLRLRSLLQTYTEIQVAEQARTLGSLSEEQFELEIQNLESIAGSVKSNQNEIDSFWKSVREMMTRYPWGFCDWMGRLSWEKL